MLGPNANSADFQKKVRIGIVESTPFRQGDNRLFKIKESTSGVVSLEIRLDGFQIESKKLDLYCKDGQLKVARNQWRPWRPGNRSEKSFKLREGSVLVTRGWPKASIGVWGEVKHKRFKSILNLEHHNGLATDKIPEWSDFDKFHRALLAKCVELGYCTSWGYEYGVGQHRVLYLANEDSVQLYARRLFRERHELVLGVYSDSLVHHMSQEKTRVKKIEDGVNVELLLTGDRIRMVNQEGDDIHDLYLPWISSEDRRDIAWRLQAFFERHRPGIKRSLPRSATNDVLVRRKIE